MKDKEEAPQFFVSRRGRQVGVHQVDLTGIDIESNDPPVTSKSTSAKKTVSKNKPPKPSKTKPPQKPGWTRKKTIVLAVVIAVLLLPVVAVELVAAQYASASNSARTDLRQLVDSTVLPSQKKNAVSADQLRDTASKVNDISTKMCRGGLLDNAAGIYPRAKNALESCRESQRKFAALTSSLYALEADARYLERIDAIMKPVATPITDEYAVIGAQQSAWKKAADSVAEVKATERMTTAHSQLRESTKKVSDEWSRLNTANNEQDAATFEDAEQTLGTAYESVRASGDAIAKILADTQAKVTTAYAALK